MGGNKICVRGLEEIAVVALATPGALQYAADELTADREFVLAAVQQYEYALEYVAAELKGDREFVLAVVQKWEAYIRQQS